MQPPQDAERWMGAGHSNDADSRAAGAAAAAQALAGRAAALLVVYCGFGVDERAMLDGVCSVTPDDTVVVGCTTNGEIAPGLEDPAAHVGVVAVALGGPGVEVRALSDRKASEHRRESGAAVAAAVADLTLPHQALLVIADGLSREQHEIVRGAYGELGAGVPIVGGCSADQLVYAVTRQFFGTGAGVEVLEDGVVGVAIGSTGPMGTGIAHGWTKTGDAMMVTSSEGGEVFLLDGVPAARVYWERVAPGRSLEDARRLRAEDLDAFRDILFRNPLGLSRRTGEDLRVVHDIDVDRGTITCLADIPQGALAWTMSTDPDALVEAAAESCSAAIDGLDGREPIGFLLWDCGARKLKLGADGLRAEQDAIEKLAAGKPFGGFYTFGEIGRTQGARGMHQLSVVTLALS